LKHFLGGTLNVPLLQPLRTHQSLNRPSELHVYWVIATSSVAILPDMPIFELKFVGVRKTRAAADWNTRQHISQQASGSDINVSNEHARTWPAIGLFRDLGSVVDDGHFVLVVDQESVDLTNKFRRTLEKLRPQRQ
jgi:hypothetical protein